MPILWWHGRDTRLDGTANYLLRMRRKEEAMSVFSSYFAGLFKQYARADVILGMALMAALTAWEMVGVFDGKLLTITDWIKSWMPMALRIMIWAWLGWHFIGSDLWLVKK